MAHHKSAEKRRRQNIKRQERNRNARATLRTSIKKTLSSIKTEDLEGSEAAAKTASSLLDKAAVHHLMHKNTAKRTISRLNKRLAALRTDKEAR